MVLVYNPEDYEELKIVDLPDKAPEEAGDGWAHVWEDITCVPILRETSICMDYKFKSF